MDPDESQEAPHESATCSHITSSELNVEIGLRQRMSETINSRIAWAMLLKETLQTDGKASVIAPESFRFTALDALKMSEKPIEFFLDREEPVPPNLRLQEALRNARPAPRSKLQVSRNPKTAFLYIRSTSITPRNGGSIESEFMILKCPVCSRTTFTSLQGLLNHARISHTLEWGTHEECVQACAIPEQDLNIQDGIEVGIGAGGILPGLRTIFEMAVGPSGSRKVINDQTPQGVDAEADPLAPNHLSRTLGLHEDTPALAPFLGKETIRRGIKVHQQDEVIDVCAVTSNPSPCVQPSNPKWRLRFAQRGEARQAEESIKPADDNAELIVNTRMKSSGDRKSESGLPQLMLSGAMTRFHFTTRIVVTDRSLWYDDGRDSSFPHKWMLTIDAPSYSYNITTVLQSMSVTPLSSLDCVRCAQPEVKQPPYVIVGLASQPFLARIDLVFNGLEDSIGDSGGQPFSLEHWVDLDPLRSSAVVVGDEQICDVELDKRTHIRPPDPEHPPTTYRSFWKLAEASLSADIAPKYSLDPTSHAAFEKVLVDLLPRFPLTVQESKRKRGMKPLPYRLVPSESQFAELIDGRRKAIEWGRVRALRDAYNNVIQQEQRADLPPLTSADVFIWLREEGHLRPMDRVRTKEASSYSEKITDAEQGSRWCSLCGLDRSIHSLLLAKQVKGENTIQEVMLSSAITGANCLIAAQHGSVTRLRPVDIQALLTNSTLSIPRHPVRNTSPALDWSLNEHVVPAADPHLTLEVRRLIHLLDLPAFRRSATRESDFPLDQLGQTPDEVDSTLAPYSLLTICLRSFIRNIVLSGLDVAKRQKGYAKAQLFSRKTSKKDGHDDESNVSLLTPTHILTGIRSHGRKGNRSSDRTDEAVLLCLSKLGTVFKPSHGEERRFEKPVVVKTEHP